MSWFDDQIRQRKAEDDRVFRESLREAAGVVLGEGRSVTRDERYLAAGALEKIMHFYHMKQVKVPDSIQSLEDQMDYMMLPQGMLYRNVELKEGWQRDATGAYLGFLKEGHAPVALIPSGMRGYSCYDASSASSWRVTGRTAERLEREAYCFYRPFPQKKMDIASVSAYILGCMRPADFLLVAAVTLIATEIGMLLPRLSSILYGTVLDHGEMSALLALAVLMICVRTAKLVVSTGTNVITSCIQMRLGMNVEAAAMMRVMSLPPSFFRSYSSGELSSRMESVDALCTSLVNAVLSTGLTSLISLLYITEIFHYAPALVLPSMIIILLTVVMSVIDLLLETARQKKIMEQDAKTLGLAFALVNGIQKIRLSGAEKRTFSHWAEAYNKSARLQYNPPYLLKVGNVISQGIQLGGTIVLYAIALSSGVSLNEFMAFIAAYGMVMGAFGSLVSVTSVFAQIRPVLDLAAPVLENVPENNGNGEVVTSLLGSVEMSHVSFRYIKDGPLVIDDLSLKINQGEYVAIVGPSGCGKSTLMRLLLGFEKPDSGGIFYDGKSLDKIDLPSLRRKIGTVMQNGGLFNDSIFANIAICAPELTMQEAWDAAEIACIADDIREMPMGMHTMISEGQGGISGGQKQRLMIARAIAPRPAILYFDEATSALDNIAQKKVINALDGLHCTRVVIAHRLSTIRSCNRILYLDGGRIREEGTYEELMAKNGLFADMVARQQTE